MIEEQEIKRPGRIPLPTIEVTREDLAPMIRNVAQKMLDNAESNTRRREVDGPEVHADSVHYMEHRFANGRYKLTVVSGPGAGESVWASGQPGDSPKIALLLSTARFYVATRQARDWEVARKRAHDTTYFCVEATREPV